MIQIVPDFMKLIKAYIHIAEIQNISLDVNLPRSQPLVNLCAS